MGCKWVCKWELGYEHPFTDPFTGSIYIDGTSLNEELTSGYYPRIASQRSQKIDASVRVGALLSDVSIACGKQSSNGPDLTKTH